MHLNANAYMSNQALRMIWCEINWEILAVMIYFFPKIFFIKS